MATSSDKDDEYFRSYTDLEVHRLMLADSARTRAYQKAIEENAEIFRGKTVMDVGAGTGILSLFCARAGAKKVFAVEASRTAVQLAEVVKLNQFEDVIQVLHSRVEEIKLTEKVDILISEWMGFYLLHESMLDSVLVARDNHLSEDGIMFPSHSTIFAAPCSLQQFFTDRVNFWDSVYGFKMTPFKDVVLGRQRTLCEPEIMYLKPEQILSEPQVVASFDLRTVDPSELLKVTKRSFVSVTKDGCFQGIALWFDTPFSPKNPDGESVLKHEVVLKTGPSDEPTHWKQTVLVLPKRENDDQEEQVETDDIIGWELTLSKAGTDSRQYLIEASVLDPAEDAHPFPCGCMSARCALISALTDQIDDDDEPFEEI